MPIYFITHSGSDPESLGSRIRAQIPELQTLGSITELSRAASVGGAQPNYVLFPFSQDQTPIERLIEIASRGAGRLFFIFISSDISANDYKRLVRAGNAEWVSTESAPLEIPDVIARQKQTGVSAQPGGAAKIISFVPGAGGVGNSTLVVETGVQIKSKKSGRQRAVCVIDLDFQTSHVCDLLDIEPRLKMQEISEHPERLDEQLFELFVSHHSSGLDVFAAARTKASDGLPSMESLDAMFSMMVQRYDLILVDLPVAWASWTEHILSASALAVVTGLNTIPSLRQITESLAAIRKVDRPPAKAVVALNRCETGLLGRVQGLPYIRKMLADQTVICVRNDPHLAVRSVNTGIPMSLSSPSAGLSKDLTKLVAEVSSPQTADRLEAAAQ
jgi:pilus assembly protein CpaE